MRRLPWPRIIVIGGLLGALAIAERSNPLASAVVVIAVACSVLALRRRRRSTARRTVVATLLMVAAGATVAALALPTLRIRPQPLVLAATGRSTARRTRAPMVWQGDGQPGAEIMGFAATDEADTAAGIDRSASGLSSIAATGLTLAAEPGAIDTAPAADALGRAHLAGAGGFAVLSNYDGNDFNADRADAVLNADAGGARAALVTTITDQVTSQGWDGVVLDLENLLPSSRVGLPDLVLLLKQSLGDRRVDVAVPASDDPTDADLRPYDLAALGAAADQIVWMTYDHHDPSSDAGPISDLPWVRNSLTVATAAILPSKILLGIAAYGYSWPAGGGTADELTVDQAQWETSLPDAIVTWDDSAAEWRGSDGNGRTIWFDDSRSAMVRAHLAAEDHLGGVAIWRIGSDDAGLVDAIAAAGLTPRKQQAAPGPRPVEQTVAKGVVALTFDDGPDPTWTPKILDVLRREQVPATFFVIGQDADANQQVLRDESATGDVIGNHSYTHPNMSEGSEARARAEILGGQAAIEGIIGQRPLLFRAPYGEGDRRNNGPGADNIAVSMGLHPIGWNVDPRDWARPGVDQIVADTLAQVTERSTILLHDGGGDRSQTVAALPHIIDALRAKGYVFTTVDGLDASLPSPYSPRLTNASKARGIGLIAAFQLQHALRDLFRWLLIAVAVLSILKVLITAPGACSQWRRARRRGPPRTFGDLVEVSVLVPAYNEERVIGTTLSTLARCRPGPTEVLVLDDGSTDTTALVATTAGMALGDRLRVITRDNVGKAGALNHGMAEAANEIVVVIDADTAVDPAIFGAIVECFDDGAVGAVAGNVKVGNRRGFLSAMQALEYVVAINWDRRSQDRMNTMAVVPGAAGAFRRSAVLSVGGYPTDTLVEDADLTVTLLRNGWRIPFEERAIAWTEAPERVIDVIRQRRRWSFGTIQVVAKHAHSILERRAGRVGLVALPSMLINQVVLPTLGPLADLYLLGLIIGGSWNQLATILAISIGLDIVVAALAIAADRERPSLLLMAPLIRLVWRPLQLWVIVRSARRFVRGDGEQWRQIRRYGSVDDRSRTGPPALVS